MKLFIILATAVSLQVPANSFLNLSDLKPVQYPILEKTQSTGKIQNLFIDFTQSLREGCSRHYGLNYNTANIVDQIRGLKFSRDVKSACLFPYLVNELNQFTKEHLLQIKKYDIPQNNMHLTLAARIYDGSFLAYIDDMDPDEVEDQKFHDLYDISTHSAILYRMIRQTLEDAITISNPWFAQNSIEKIRDVRKIAGWISEVTPWSYFYRLGFSTICERSPFKDQCELDKKLVQASLVKGLEQLRQQPDKYEYIIKLREHLEIVQSLPKSYVRRGLQVLRGLSGDYVPYMLGPSVQVQGRLLKIDLNESFKYLETSKIDLEQYVTPHMDKISEEYACKTILRSFISLQKEGVFSLKEEMKHLNPFSHVTENTNILEDEKTKDGMSVRDLLEKVNCKKIRDLYGVPLAEEGFITRFLAYQGRAMLSSTAYHLSGLMGAEEINEMLIYTQMDDVLSAIERVIPVEARIQQSPLNESQNKETTEAGKYLFNFTNGLFN